MRIAIVQTDPTLSSDTAVNRVRVWELLESKKLLNSSGGSIHSQDCVDAFIFPELSFSKYCFERKEDASMIAESANGPTFQWAQKLATLTSAFVQVGLVLEEGNCLFNAVLLVGPDGTLRCTYRKHFLFDVDTIWAEEGPSFHSFAASDFGSAGPTQIGLGICMDINPYKFEAPFDEMEFSNFHASHGSQFILFSSAWCTDIDNPPNQEQTWSYWAMRLRALRKSNCQYVYFICANRVGEELRPQALGQREGMPAPGSLTLFVGGSAVIRMPGKLSEDPPTLIAGMPHRNEDVLVVHLP
jgi:protein N-terminal amidase